MIALKPQISMNLRLFSAIAVFGASILLAPASSGQDLPYQIFERYLAPLAGQIGMPGLSAVIVRNNRIEWEKGYGFADLEKKVHALPDTPYAIGGVTQAMTAVLLGVCSDRRRDPMDRLIREWDPTFPEPAATVRHVLAHASNGSFRYDEPQFASLTRVVEDCLGQPYRVALAQEILRRSPITSSAPGLDLDRPEGAAARALFEPDQVAMYQAVLARLAKPYRVDSRSDNPVPVRSEYPSNGLDAAGGMVASARDLAEFEISLNKQVPLSRNTLDQMWTATTFGGVTMPTGLGWFVKTTSGQALVWSYGYIPDASSALILKMPSKNLTLILLSNSDRLAATYQLEKGDVTNSPFVKIFLRLFI
jgi:CubicO group peptidase (beta-lactamase class C family)